MKPNLIPITSSAQIAIKTNRPHTAVKMLTLALTRLNVIKQPEQSLFSEEYFFTSTKDANIVCSCCYPDFANEIMFYDNAVYSRMKDTNQAPEQAVLSAIALNPKLTHVVIETAQQRRNFN